MRARHLRECLERSLREPVVVMQQLDPVASAREHRIVCILDLALTSPVLDDSDAGLHARIFRQDGPTRSLGSFVIADHQFPVGKLLMQYAFDSTAHHIRTSEGWNGHRNERAMSRTPGAMGSVELQQFHSIFPQDSASLRKPLFCWPTRSGRPSTGRRNRQEAVLKAKPMTPPAAIK